MGHDCNDCVFIELNVDEFPCSACAIYSGSSSRADYWIGESDKMYAVLKNQIYIMNEIRRLRKDLGLKE